MLHPELVAFQARLERAGLVAVRHADHICLRLGLLCAVRVRYDGERLTCEPRFGALSRTAATFGTLGVATAGVGAAALGGIALPIVVALGSLGVLAVGYDALRYVVTEGAITRATLLWGLEHEPPARLAEGASRDALPAPGVDPLALGVESRTPARSPTARQ